MERVVWNRVFRTGLLGTDSLELGLNAVEQPVLIFTPTIDLASAHELVAERDDVAVSQPAGELRSTKTGVAEPTRDRGRPYALAKGTVDIVSAGALLVALGPLMGAIAAAVRLSSPGPVIFKQKRLTRDGRLFTMYKFRTMCQDAEAKTGPIWARESDPRVTTVGKILRRTRLDELPQLFNVLRGEMSLIGPRPERPEVAERLSTELPDFQKRLSVKAGITGLAQVSTGYAASVESYRRKLELDLEYIHRASILLDLKIVLQTILVVLTARGSH